MNGTTQQLITYLQQIAELRAGGASGLGGNVGPEAWLLMHGHAFTNFRPLPRWLKRGRMKYCYRNSFQAVIDHPDRLVYCEGYAAGSVMPVPHAWVLDRVGNKIYDPTWDYEHEAGYFGIAFSLEYVRAFVLGGEEYASVLDDWQNGWPLQSGKVPIEQWREEISGVGVEPPACAG